VRIEICYANEKEPTKLIRAITWGLKSARMKGE